MQLRKSAVARCAEGEAQPANPAQLRGKSEMAFRRKFKREKGSTLVEFAFVFMLLMTMMLGLVDFGRALYTYHFISGAARQAARWAIVNGSTCADDGSCTAPISCSSGSCTPCTSGCAVATTADVQNYVKMLAQGASIDTSSTDCGGSACLTTTPTWNPAGSNGPAVCSGSVGPPVVVADPKAPGCTVEVQVSYNFNFLVPLVRSTSITMSSTSEMVISH
jgi:Flp pilus assembly protein TadG